MVQKIHKPLRLVEDKEINDDRQDNRADARGTAEKEPGNHFWGGPSVHASVDSWVCSVMWSLTSSYDSDHIAADSKRWRHPSLRESEVGVGSWLPSGPAGQPDRKRERLRTR